SIGPSFLVSLPPTIVRAAARVQTGQEMNEDPQLSLPRPRPCPFAAPDGYDRVRETPGLATAELPGGALTWLVTRLEEARAALAAPEFSTDRSEPAFPLPQQRPRPAGAR